MNCPMCGAPGYPRYDGAGGAIDFIYPEDYESIKSRGSGRCDICGDSWQDHDDHFCELMGRNSFLNNVSAYITDYPIDWGIRAEDQYYEEDDRDEDDQRIPTWMKQPSVQKAILDSMGFWLMIQSINQPAEQHFNW